MFVIDKLLEKLEFLHMNHGLIGLKGGTEVEDMTFNELMFLKQLCSSIGLPLIVKIGGPEARNDIRYCHSIDVDGILAPMVESEYALENFVSAITDICNDIPYLAINIETITAYNNITAIFESKSFNAINQITVGRSDLSKSLKRNVDDEYVINITADIVRQAKLYGKITSVGGSINPYNASLIVNTVFPDRINTRHLIFDCAKTCNIGICIQMGLEFELDLYKALSNIEPQKYSDYQRRINLTLSRMSVSC